MVALLRTTIYGQVNLCQTSCSTGTELGNLWDTQFINNSTPADAVEYSLSLFGNFESINKYTTRKSWDNCDIYKAEKNKKLQGDMKNLVYPRVSFSPYFQYNGDLMDV